MIPFSTAFFTSLLGIWVFTPASCPLISTSSQVYLYFLPGLLLHDSHTLDPGAAHPFIDPELGQ
jgi:hypothetical protein